MGKTPRWLYTVGLHYTVHWRKLLHYICLDLECSRIDIRVSAANWITWSVTILTAQIYSNFIHVRFHRFGNTNLWLWEWVSFGYWRNIVRSNKKNRREEGNKIDIRASSQTRCNSGQRRSWHIRRDGVCWAVCYSTIVFNFLRLKTTNCVAVGAEGRRPLYDLLFWTNGIWVPIEGLLKPLPAVHRPDRKTGWVKEAASCGTAIPAPSLQK